MFTIDKQDNTITMIQGDTAVIVLALEDYPLSEGDKVEFAIVSDDKFKRNSQSLLVHKVLTSFETDGRARIILYEKDTINLKPRDYFYEIQVTTKDSGIDTVIPLTKLTIKEGVIRGRV